MDNNIAVVGLGKSGISTVKFLVEQGFTPDLFDSRTKEKVAIDKYDFIKSKNLNCFFGEFNADLLKKYSTIIISPGLSVNHKSLKAAKEQGVDIIGDIELFARYVKKPVIGITGSNGKSTVTTLTYEILKEAGFNVRIGGNIGIPALDIISDDVDVYVLELSSFQLETTKSLELTAATILNVSEDHLDRYDGQMKLYIEAKKRIYMNAKNIIVNRADSNTYPEYKMNNIVSFGEDDQSYGKIKIDSDEFLSFNGTSIINVSELAIKGTHNEMNALVAIGLTDVLGVSRDAQLRVLKKFNGLSHRCQLVRELDGICYYNDSKATNVGATLAAVNGLKNQGNIILLAGGQGKGQDFTPIKNLLGKEVSFMFCFGQDGKLLAELGQNTLLCKNMKEAISEAKKISKSGDIILLAPACASLDQFISFEDRGDTFANIVRGL